uniref:hypothetical protein n=1 Tax=Sebaldella termitidis TaxID=826 RepID=UPI003EBE19AC
MKVIAECLFTNDYERMKEVSIFIYGSFNEEELMEIDNSISDSNRRYKVIFYEDMFCIHNLSKDEMNSYSYSELFKIEKRNRGYVFFIDKVNIFYVIFDDFKEDELNILDNTIKSYYEVVTDAVVVIENVEWTNSRVYTGLINIYHFKTFKIACFLVTIFTLIMSLNIMSKNNNKAMILLIISFIPIILVIFYLIFYRIMAKQILSSMNENNKKFRVLFYEDKLEIITLKKLTVSTVKYSEFYKIKKFKKGYLFNIQKY